MPPLLLALPALSTILALTPIRRPFPVAVAGWVVGLAASEAPLHLAVLVVAVAGSALLAGPVTVADLAGAGMAVGICAGLAVVLARHLAAARALEDSRALDGARVPDGAGAPTAATATTTTKPAALPRTPWLTVLFRPWPMRPRNVRPHRGLVYGPDPHANRFDLYTRADGTPVRGVLIHLHGGHFRAGGPSRESRAMLFDHASRGWAAVSATYHLSSPPESAFPQHLVDIKRLIAWIRTEGERYGIPAGAPIVVAGSSAGAHIALMTALTAGEPEYQPGFEDVDTAVAGAIGLYGYYGPLGPRTKAVSDPVRRPARHAPPIAVIHGTLDTYTPVRGSRRLVRHLREESANPVMYAELPGAQHGFDAVRSPRYLAVVAAVRRFTDELSPPAGR